MIIASSVVLLTSSVLDLTLVYLRLSNVSIAFCYCTFISSVVVVWWCGRGGVILTMVVVVAMVVTVVAVVVVAVVVVVVEDATQGQGGHTEDRCHQWGPTAHHGSHSLCGSIVLSMLGI